MVFLNNLNKLWANFFFTETGGGGGLTPRSRAPGTPPYLVGVGVKQTN